jgi:hypothetical protein
MTEANALHSLYGGKDALAGNVGGQARDQEAWTPDDLLAAVRTALGGKIVLDVCGASRWSLPEVRDKRGKVQRAAVPHGGWFADITIARDAETQVSPHGGLVLQADGLDVDWAGRPGFDNPPYNDLRRWLTKAAETGKTGTPHVHLGPVRTQRKWWLPLARTGEIVFLNYNVKFKGWKCAVPFPVCLIAWNCTIPDLGSKETGRWDRQS